MSVTNPTPADRLRWICNTSAEEGRAEVKRLMDRNEPADILPVLTAALAYEQEHSKRSSLVKPLDAAIGKCRSAITNQTLSIVTARSTPMSKTTLKNPALTEIEISVAGHLKTITTKIAGFEDSILGDRLKVGLHALKAHVLFSVKADKRKGIGGRGKTASAADGVSTGGFEGWLAERFHPVDHPLKKGTAYAWMTALKGLGLDENATEEEVDEALAQNRRVGPVSIKSLCNAAVEAITDSGNDGDGSGSTQTEFEFLRDGLADFRKQADALLALKADLHKHPDMERVAAARVYSLLKELTGTDWKPSDEPDDLASVNPDQIEL